MAKQSKCFRQVETCAVLILRLRPIFIYFGSAVTTENDVSLEIKCRIPFANRCYYGLNGQEYVREKSYVRSSAQCQLAVISAFDSIVSCKSSLTT